MMLHGQAQNTGHILDKLQNMVNANIKFMKSLFEVKSIQPKLLDMYLVRNSENTFPLGITLKRKSNFLLYPAISSMERTYGSLR